MVTMMAQRRSSSTRRRFSRAKLVKSFMYFIYDYIYENRQICVVIFLVSFNYTNLPFSVESAPDAHFRFRREADWAADSPATGKNN